MLEESTEKNWLVEDQGSLDQLGLNMFKHFTHSFPHGLRELGAIDIKNVGMLSVEWLEK